MTSGPNLAIPLDLELQLERGALTELQAGYHQLAISLRLTQAMVTRHPDQPAHAGRMNEIITAMEDQALQVEIQETAIRDVADRLAASRGGAGLTVQQA